MAFLGTALAGLCAFLAVSDLMLCALIAAGLADIGAKLANLLCELTATRHVSSSHPANFRAIHVERNAPGHHFHVLFLKAGHSAVVTCSSTVITCSDTGLKFLV